MKVGSAASYHKQRISLVEGRPRRRLRRRRDKGARGMAKTQCLIPRDIRKVVSPSPMPDVLADPYTRPEYLKRAGTF